MNSFSINTEFFNHTYQEGFYPLIKSKENIFIFKLSKIKTSTPNVEKINLLKEQILKYGIKSFIQNIMKIVDPKSQAWSNFVINISQISRQCQFRREPLRQLSMNVLGTPRKETLEISLRKRTVQPSLEIFSPKVRRLEGIDELIQDLDKEWNRQLNKIEYWSILSAKNLELAKEGFIFDGNHQKQRLSFERLNCLLNTLISLNHCSPKYQLGTSLLAQFNQNWIHYLKYLPSMEERRDFIVLMFRSFRESVNLPPFFNLFDRLDKSQKKTFVDWFANRDSYPVILLAYYLKYELNTSESFLFFSLKYFTIYNDHFEADYIKSYAAFNNWLLDTGLSVHYVGKDHTILELFYSACPVYFKTANREIPSEILGLFKRLKDLDGDFSFECYQRIALANMYGISSSSRLKDFHISYEGMTAYSINELFQQDLVAYQMNILEKMILKNDSQSQVLRLVKCIEADKENCFILNVDCQEHVASIVRYKEFLLLGNQGYGCGEYPGVLIFKFDEKLFSEEALSAIEMVKYIHKEEHKMRFFSQKALRKLGAEFVYHVELPEQQGSHCPWYAFKLSIFSTMIIATNYQKMRTGVFDTEFDNTCEDSYNLTRQLTNGIRHQFFEDYKELHKAENYPFEADTQLIKQIEEID